MTDFAPLLALASAALYGAADFLGGMASRRTNAVAVVVVSQLAGLVVLALLMPLFPAATPSTRDLGFGAVAGLAGGAGVAMLYRALAVGTMAIVAPTTAVCAVAIPVIAAVMLGERPSPLTVGGILLALLAILLVSQERPRIDGVTTAGSRGVPPGLGLALLSGVAIGLFFLALARTDRAAGMWPLVVARATSVVMFAIPVVAGRRSLRMLPAVAAIAIGGGIIDVLANALYLLASRVGPLTIVVTLASLYPASTVVLARVVLGERLNALQVLGIVCALGAVVLIVATS
jgi:drug/metabolite transporter (DMT)-like permease